ncbi:MAG: hypothetical protein OXC30_01335 [Alphaproteobacteria bacterium]|nr:hypothetical protein [Alphaproteobacteria bacterium]
MIFLLLFLIALDAHSASESFSDDSVELNSFEYCISDNALIMPNPLYDASDCYSDDESDDESELRDPRSKTILLSHTLEGCDAKKNSLKGIKILIKSFLKPISRQDTHYTLDALHNVIEIITFFIEKMWDEQLHPLSDTQRLDGTSKEIDEELHLDLKAFLTSLQPGQLDLEAFSDIVSELKICLSILRRLK